MVSRYPFPGDWWYCTKMLFVHACCTRMTIACWVNTFNHKGMSAKLRTLISVTSNDTQALTRPPILAVWEFTCPAEDHYIAHEGCVVGVKAVVLGLMSLSLWLDSMHDLINVRQLMIHIFPSVYTCRTRISHSVRGLYSRGRKPTRAQGSKSR